MAHYIDTDLQLKGKLAFVSGSSAGIGFVIAESLAREGARVIINDRTQARVDAALTSPGDKVDAATRWEIAAIWE